MTLRQSRGESQITTLYNSDKKNQSHLSTNESNIKSIVQTQLTGLKKTYQKNQQKKTHKQLQILREKFRKQQELLYIYRNQFRKLEQIFYYGCSPILHQQLPNIQKTSLYLSNFINNIAEVQSKSKQKTLSAVPVIYKKRNVKTYQLNKTIL